MVAWSYGVVPLNLIGILYAHLQIAHVGISASHCRKIYGNWCNQRFFWTLQSTFQVVVVNSGKGCGCVGVGACVCVCYFWYNVYARMHGALATVTIISCEHTYIDACTYVHVHACGHVYVRCLCTYVCECVCVRAHVNVAPVRTYMCTQTDCNAIH